MHQLILSTVTNADLLTEIQKISKSQNNLQPLIASAIVAVATILTTLIANWYSSRNMETQLKSQVKLNKTQYFQKESLQKHDFINRTILEKLNDLSSVLPEYFRENVKKQIVHIEDFYYNYSKFGVHDQRTQKAGIEALRINHKLGIQRNIKSAEIKRLLAYSQPNDRKEFENIDNIVSEFIINDITKYIEDINLGVDCRLNPEDVLKKLKDYQFNVMKKIISINNSIDNQVIALVSDMKN